MGRFYVILRTPSGWTFSAWLAATFRALDGQQLLVVEGSPPPVLCQLISANCGHTHLDSLQLMSKQPQQQRINNQTTTTTKQQQQPNNNNNNNQTTTNQTTTTATHNSNTQQQHNNNNNNNRRSSVLTGEELHPTLRSLLMLSPKRVPNPIPAIPPHVVRTPHLHGAPTTEETSTVKL